MNTIQQQYISLRFRLPTLHSATPPYHYYSTRQSTYTSHQPNQSLKPEADFVITEMCRTVTDYIYCQRCRRYCVCLDRNYKCRRAATFDRQCRHGFQQERNRRFTGNCIDYGFEYHADCPPQSEQPRPTNTTSLGLDIIPFAGLLLLLYQAGLFNFRIPSSRSGRDHEQEDEGQHDSDDGYYT